MNRTSFLSEILPAGVGLGTVAAGPDELRVYDRTINSKLKDINFIKRVAREKVRLNGAPIRYFPIIPESANTGGFDALKDHTDIELGPPIDMIATWTPQEYQLDLSKWGVMMPTGTDQQLFIHVDELTEFLGRKPLIGDIIDTVTDTMRYRVSDVYYGHANLWENIFCMVTLTKTTYNNYTSQLDQYGSIVTDDETGTTTTVNYAETYTKLQDVLDIVDTMDGGSTTLVPESNAELIEDKISTEALIDQDRSIKTATNDIQDVIDNGVTVYDSNTSSSPTDTHYTGTEDQGSSSIVTKEATDLDIMTMRL